MQIAPTPSTAHQVSTSDVSNSTDASVDFMQFVNATPPKKQSDVNAEKLDFSVEKEGFSKDVESDEHGEPVETEEVLTGTIPALPSAIGTSPGVQRAPDLPLQDVDKIQAQGLNTNQVKLKENSQPLIDKPDSLEAPKEQIVPKKFIETNLLSQKIEQPIRYTGEQNTKSIFESRMTEIATASKPIQQSIGAASGEVNNGILTVPPARRANIMAAETPVVVEKRPNPEGVSLAAGVVLQQFKQTAGQPVVSSEIQLKPDLVSRDILPDRVSLENMPREVKGTNHTPQGAQSIGAISAGFLIDELNLRPSLDVETLGFGAVSDIRAAPLSGVTAQISQHVPQNFTPATAHQVAVAVHQTQDGVTELVLNPEELGRVRLAINSQDGVMAVTITTERPETQDLMRRHIDMLAQEMKALGYDSVGFTFEGQGSDPHGGQGSERQSHEQDAQLQDTHAPLAAATSGLDLRL